MRLKPEDKRAISERIATGAAAMFRRRGFAAVNIDAVMAEAGLTRGAFYAHFASKEALFAEVLRAHHPLIRMLRGRDGADGTALCAQMRAIFADYLAPGNHDRVSVGCTFAALGGDAARGSDAVRAAWEAAWRDALREMARGQPAPPGDYAAPLALATGAVRTATALATDAARAELLGGASRAVDAMLARAGGG